MKKSLYLPLDHNPDFLSTIQDADLEQIVFTEATIDHPETGKQVPHGKTTIFMRDVDNEFYLQARGKMDNGGKSGYWQEYSADHRTYSNVLYIHGVITGHKNTFYTKTGHMAVIEPHEKGKKEGDFYYYNEYNYLEKIVPYRNNKKNGIEKTFHSTPNRDYYSGQKIKSETLFQDGIPQGFGLNYNENGTLSSLTLYRDNGTIHEKATKEANHYLASLRLQDNMLSLVKDDRRSPEQKNDARLGLVSNRYAHYIW